MFKYEKYFVALKRTFNFTSKNISLTLKGMKLSIENCLKNVVVIK